MLEHICFDRLCQAISVLLVLFASFLFVSFRLSRVKMNVNSLPAVPLRIIFGKLTLEELIHVRRVCRLWRSYQEKITSELGSVTLLVGTKPLDLITDGSFVIKHLDEVRKDDGKPMYEPQWDRKWARITFKKLNMDTAKMLLHILSGVTSISIAVDGMHSKDVINELTCLLYQLSPQLVSVKLYFNFLKGEGPFANAEYENVQETDPRSNTVRSRINAQNIIKLLGTINIFPLLEHLTLDFKQDLNGDWNGLLALDFSIIHRLREFNIFTWNCRFDNIFEDWLKVTDEPEYCQKCRESRLERIGTRIRDRNNSIMIYFGKQHPWASKFTTIPPFDSADCFFFPDNYNKTLSTDFRSLTSLEYHYYPQCDKFDGILKVLAPLNQLISLTLNVNGAPLPENDDNFIDFNFSLSSFDRMEPIKFAQLTSVRVLTLRLSMKRHSNIFSRHWGWIFPNVQVLEVKHNCFGTAHWTYADCNHYVVASRDTVPNSQLIDGIRDLLRPFKQMPKLHTVHTHFPQDKKWTRNEI